MPIDVIDGGALKSVVLRVLCLINLAREGSEPVSGVRLSQRAGGRLTELTSIRYAP